MLRGMNVGAAATSFTQMESFKRWTRRQQSRYRRYHQRPIPRASKGQRRGCWWCGVWWCGPAFDVVWSGRSSSLHFRTCAFTHSLRDWSHFVPPTPVARPPLRSARVRQSTANGVGVPLKRATRQHQTTTGYPRKARLIGTKDSPSSVGWGLNFTPTQRGRMGGDGRMGVEVGRWSTRKRLSTLRSRQWLAVLISLWALVDLVAAGM